MTAYDSAVLLDTPLAYYECAESSGTTLTDSSGNSHNGSWNTSGVTLASAGPGDGSTSALLDGSAGFGSAALNLTASNQLTFEAWIYQYTFSSSGDNLAAEFDSPYFSNNGSFLVDMNFGSVTNTIAYGSHGSGGSNVSTIPQPTAAAWHHYVFYLDLTTTEPLGCYVDGVSQTETQDLGAAGGGDFANSTLYIGARSGTSLFNQMRVAKVAIYNGFLSPTRITAHFDAMPTNTDLAVSVADSTTTGETPSAAPLVLAGVTVGDSATTAEVVTANVVSAGDLNVSVSDSTATAETFTAQFPAGPDLNVSVADSTATGEPQIVIAFDPDITFTLEVNVADSTTTGESVSASVQAPLGTLQINVADSTTVSQVVSVGSPSPLHISVQDTTATGDQVVVAFPGSFEVWLPTNTVLQDVRLGTAVMQGKTLEATMKAEPTEVILDG